MKIVVHSMGIALEIETDSIQGYAWSERLQRAILILDQPRRMTRLPIDETLHDLELKFRGY